MPPDHMHLRRAVIATTLIWLASCSESNSGETSSDNVVNVYNWSDYIGLETLDRFEAEYGIKVNYDLYDAAAVVDVKLLTGNSGYDVVFHSNQLSSRLTGIGVFQKLDFSRLPNMKNLDPDTMAAIDIYEKVRGYTVPYHWGSTGYAWNVEMVRERLPNQSMESADVLFDPEILSKLADCGVSFLDSATSMMPIALAYLGLDPSATDKESMDKVEELIAPVRPYIRYFSNEKFISDLPNQELCLAMSWSGDYVTSAQRAQSAGLDIELQYAVPMEGAPLWVDGMYIPADAPHTDNAYKFINFVLQGDVAAEIAEEVQYANANRASWEFLSKEALENPAIYPDSDVWGQLFTVEPADPVEERFRTRALARIKSGL